MAKIKAAKNYKHIIAVLPTGDWAEIGTGTEVTFYGLSDKQFEDFTDGNSARFQSEIDHPYQIVSTISLYDIHAELAKVNAKP